MIGPEPLPKRVQDDKRRSPSHAKDKEPEVLVALERTIRHLSAQFCVPPDYPTVGGGDEFAST